MYGWTSSKSLSHCRWDEKTSSFQDVSRNPGKQESTQFCPVSIWSTVVDVEDVLDVEVDDVLDEVVEEEDTVDEVLHSYFINSKQDL